MAAGVELSDISWLAVGAAMLFNIVLGFLWYNPKLPTGRIWVLETGMDVDAKPSGRAMAMTMGLMLVGVFLTMFVLAHVVVAFRDAYLLDDATYQLSWADGLMGGFFTWLGFYLPVQLNGVAFERKSWSLTMVNAGYYLVALLAAGLILALVP